MPPTEIIVGDVHCDSSRKVFERLNKGSGITASRLTFQFGALRSDSGPEGRQAIAAVVRPRLASHANCRRSGGPTLGSVDVPARRAFAIIRVQETADLTVAATSCRPYRAYWRAPTSKPIVLRDGRIEVRKSFNQH
jgi:hypothetical protein